MNIIRLIFTQRNAERRRRAVSEEQRHTPSDHRDGKDHSGGGITQVSHAVSNENLIHDVIKTGNDEREDAWNGKFQKQLSGFSVPR